MRTRTFMDQFQTKLYKSKLSCLFIVESMSERLVIVTQTLNSRISKKYIGNALLLNIFLIMYINGLIHYMFCLVIFQVFYLLTLFSLFA